MTAPADAEPLPCPFCGGPAEPHRLEAQAGRKEDNWVAREACSFNLGKPNCTREEAIAAWNCRAPISAALAAEREHHAWWRPARCGYTKRIEAAGIYDFEDAYSATERCGPEKLIEYHRVRP